MGTAADFLLWARAQLGVTENPPNSNHVRYWDAIGLHGDQGQPWCAAWYLAGLLAIGVTPVCRSGWVPGIYLAYGHAKRLYPVSQAQPGDQLIYSIGKGHTGVVVSIDAKTRTVAAIEGNTSPGTAGSQDNGGGVFLRTRPWSLVRGVGRPPFASAQVAGPIHHAEEADMAMIVLDTKGPDDQGRDSHWEIDKRGNVFNWNGARPLRALLELDPNAKLPIVAVSPDPSGDGVVMFSDDAHQDERGHWVRSTYKVVVS